MVIVKPGGGSGYNPKLRTTEKLVPILRASRQPLDLKGQDRKTLGKRRDSCPERRPLSMLPHETRQALKERNRKTDQIICWRNFLTCNLLVAYTDFRGQGLQGAC